MEYTHLRLEWKTGAGYSKGYENNRATTVLLILGLTRSLAFELGSNNNSCGWRLEKSSLVVLVLRLSITDVAGLAE